MQENEHAGTYQCGAHTISRATRRLERNGDTVDLEAKVFDLILLLVENRARALGKQEIVTTLWGRRPVTDAALSQLVYKARRALDDDGEQQSVIRTVYGHGLQWVAPVVEVPAEPPRDTPGVSPASTAVGTQAPIAPAAPQRVPRRRRRTGWLALGALALIIALSIWIIPRSFAPPAPPAPRVAVLPMQNVTGDDALAWTARGLPGLIASLVGEGSDLDVVDPLQVARVWGFTPTDGRSHGEHARYVLNADVLVGGELRKLPGDLYELTLHVDAGTDRDGSDIVLTGPDPGALGIHSVSRIRHALNLQRHQKKPSRGPSPQDAYLAETFARGMDRAMGGDWPAAKPYFELVAKGEPEFLPGRLRLAVAQMNTNQPEDAQHTLNALLDRSRQRDDSLMAARTVLQVATLDLVQHDFEAALGHLRQAGTFAERSGNIDLQAAIALKVTSASASLQRTSDAEIALKHARTLIQDHALHRLESDLHNSEVFLATARSDYAAAEQAGRAALAASTAIGNEHDALIDTYNLALNLSQRGRSEEALRLFARTWVRSQKTNFTVLAFASGDNLAIALVNAGMSDRAASITAELQELGRKHDNRAWQALALMLRAGQEWYDDKAVEALASCRQAEALVDGEQDPTLLINLWVSQASASLIADRASLPALARRVDALVAAQSQPEAFVYLHQLIHAMAAAASGRREDTAAALEAAAGATPTNDPARDNLRYIGLTIALATDDAHAAGIALAGYDPAHGNNADVLRLYGQWAKKRGDTRGLQLSADRLMQLRHMALAALTEVPI